MQTIFETKQVNMNTTHHLDKARKLVEKNSTWLNKELPYFTVHHIITGERIEQFCTFKDFRRRRSAVM